jgi:hypothetical protein
VKQLWTKYLPHLLGGLALVCLSMAGYQTWMRTRFEARMRQADAATERAAHVADSVTKLDAQHKQRIAELLRSQAASERAADLWRDRAQATESALANLATLRNRLSDSLKLFTTASDSLRAYGAIVANLTEANTKLQTSLAAALNADANRRQALDSLRLVHVEDSVRYLGLELVYTTTRRALDKSQRALASATGQCRLLPFIPCPSRKGALAAGAVIGAVVTAYLTATH